MNLTQAIPRSCARPLTTCTWAKRPRGRGGLPKKKRSTPSCRTENAIAAAVKGLFLTRRAQPNLAFSLIQVIPSLNWFQNRFVRTPDTFENRGLAVFYVVRLSEPPLVLISSDNRRSTVVLKKLLETDS